MLTDLSDRERLAAILGGLLTFPELAELTPAIGVAAERVLAANEAASFNVNQTGIRAMVAGIVVELNSPDRMPNPFTDLLTTPFGSVTARCDFADDSVRNAEALIEAVLMADDDSAGAEGLAWAVFRLMEEVATRSGWQPYERSLETIPDLPGEERLAELASRVIFDEATLAHACGATWAEALAPLTLGDDPSRARERPLLRCRSGHVVVTRPEALAGALAFALAQRVHERDGGDRLDEALSVLSVDRTLSNIAELGLRHMRAAPDVESPFPHSSSLVFLDADAVLHVMALTPDLTLGVPPPGAYWHPPSSEDIPPHLARVERRIREEAPHVEAVVHLVVLDAAGAQPMLHLDRPADTASPHLVLTTSELEWLVRHPDVKPRDLAAFAYDLAQLRTRVNYVSSSQLDDFQIWRSEALGFASIEAAAADEFDRVVMAAGFARDVRLDVVDRFEPRVAPAPDGEGEWRIARWLEYRDVELWRPWGSPDWPPHFFVPGIGRGIWILDVGDAGDEGWDVRRKHTELVAYWLWRLQDQLPLLRAAAERCATPIQIHMTIELTSEDMTVESGDDEPAFHVVATSEGVHVTVHPSALLELGGPDSAPEHAFIQRVIDALCASVGAAESDAPEFPAGLRKLVYLSSANPAVERVIAPHGLVHQSYRARAHRVVGTRLMVDHGLKAGKIADEEINSVLHTAVQILQAELERQLDDLDTRQARLLLMGTYERLAHDRTIADIELAAIDEFFGHDADAAQRRVDEFGSLSEASVACRYVIELAATKPPSGTRIVSDHVLQNLLATALSIVYFGRLSDLIHFGLTRDARAAIVPPGILMASAPDYVEAHEQFASALRRGDVERSAALRDRMLRQSYSTPHRELADRIADAHLADHGCTLDDIGRVLNALAHVPTNPLRVAQLSRDEIEAVAAGALDEPERAGVVIGLLTLGPRDSFFQPPAPHTWHDVVPWRFNRGLSYLRRPLVLVRAEDNAEHYLFGPAMCFAAAEVLDDLTRTARLGWEGSKLRRATVELQRALSKDFEDTVAEVVEAAPAWQARRRVKKIGSHRIQRPNGEDLGDVDVLAVSPSLRLAMCIEAKSLAGALAPHQLRHEFDENFGSGGKRPSAATKLTERCQFVAANANGLLRSFGIDDAPASWRVGACIVTDYENLGALLEACPVPVLTLRELRVQLADGSFDASKLVVATAG
jgi:hypothetical protein